MRYEVRYGHDYMFAEKMEPPSDKCEVIVYDNNNFKQKVMYFIEIESIEDLKQLAKDSVINGNHAWANEDQFSLVVNFKDKIITIYDAYLE